MVIATTPTKDYNEPRPIDAFILDKLSSIETALADIEVSMKRQTRSTDNSSETDHSSKSDDILLRSLVLNLSTKLDSFDTKIDRKLESVENKVNTMNSDITEIKMDVKAIKKKQQEEDMLKRDKDQKSMWRYSFAVGAGALGASILRFFM